MTVNEAAAMLRMSRGTFYKLLNEGVIRAVKSGQRTLVHTAALHEYANSLLAYAPSLQSKRKTSAADQAREGLRMLRIKAVMARTTLSPSTIYMRVAQGTFPPKMSLGGRESGWREADVDEWMADPSGYRAPS